MKNDPQCNQEADAIQEDAKFTDFISDCDESFVYFAAIGVNK